MVGLLTNSISIVELATLVTAAGVGIYVLGLVGVALSLYLTFTDYSWSTAWYAASLMPRAVVAGQGVRLWRRGMLYALISLLFVIVVLVIVWVLLAQKIITVHGTRTAAPFSSILALLGAMDTQVFSAILVLLGALGPQVLLLLNQRARARRSTRGNGPQPKPLPLRNRIIMATIGALITLVAAYVMWRALKTSLPSGFETTVTNWDSMAVGALLLLVGVFTLGVSLAEDVKHPLPMVGISLAKPEEQTSPKADENDAQGTPESQEAPVDVSGWLVAHGDSCWHLFISERAANRGQSERVYLLVSIPDDRVSEARVYEDGDGSPGRTP